MKVVAIVNLNLNLNLNLNQRDEHDCGLLGAESALPERRCRCLAEQAVIVHREPSEVVETPAKGDLRDRHVAGVRSGTSSRRAWFRRSRRW